jgi:dephospho-CoA kinase
VRLVGLTGGIGTGKSTVSAMLRELGATVIDADEAARAVVEPGTEGLRLVVEAFGDEVLAPDGSLDRARLAQIVFQEPERRRVLESITWPRVGAWMAERTQEAAARGERVVVHDIPLLFENPARRGAYERVILVYAPTAVALQRLVRRGLGEADARARIASQRPIDEKRALADVVIDNSDGLERTRAQVERAWAEITAEAGSGA